MSSQMYIDLSVQALMKAAGTAGESVTFTQPVIGTFDGSSVSIDAFPEPVPYSDFSFQIDDKTTTRPSYQSGDRLVIVPVNDGKQLVITGRLI